MNQQATSEKGTQLWREVPVSEGLPRLDILNDGYSIAVPVITKINEGVNAGIYDFGINGWFDITGRLIPVVSWLERLPEQQTEEDGWVRIIHQNQKKMEWRAVTILDFENEDWEFFHYRYIDKTKLETHVWDVKDGFLQKKGGTGVLPFNQIQILVENV